MSRGHTPYGYRIENGVAVVCEEQADQIRSIYKGYLGGLSLVGAAREAGLTMTHCSVKHMMLNSHYLGDDFYPAIIDKETFDAFEVERQRREIALGRNNRDSRPVKTITPLTSFRLGKAARSFPDPYRQAEYVYSLIESEV